ncbi:MAG: hypothetical protein CMJ27_11485 [Phycisphaerae bacterium]|nr:hypothetical protein [Phycisphaerae bacterium]
MPKPPSTVRAYLDALPEDRREAVEAVFDVIERDLPKGYETGMQYGMPAWFVSHAVYPDGYHCDPTQPVPFVSIASQKKHIGLYFFCVYLDEDLQAWFEAEWRNTGKRWDAGKSCVRVKSLDDIPLPLIGRLIKKTPVRSSSRAMRRSGPSRRRRRSERSPPPGRRSRRRRPPRTPRRSGRGVGRRPRFERSDPVDGPAAAPSNGRFGGAMCVGRRISRQDRIVGSS